MYDRRELAEATAFAKIGTTQMMQSSTHIHAMIQQLSNHHERAVVAIEHDHITGHRRRHHLTQQSKLASPPHMNKNANAAGPHQQACPPFGRDFGDDSKGSFVAGVLLFLARGVLAMFGGG